MHARGPASGPAFARSHEWSGHMLDLIMIGLVVAFLAGCVAYALACERL
jgi:hypothetical protein